MIKRLFRIVFQGELTSLDREWMITYLAIFSLTIFLASTILSMFRRGQVRMENSLKLSNILSVNFHSRNYFQWKKNEKHLVAVINRLEGQLLVSTKEISTLEEQINDVKTKVWICVFISTTSKKSEKLIILLRICSLSRVFSVLTRKRP